MNFNSHSRLTDKHSFLSPSSYHWINYDEQKLDARFWSKQAAAKGTRLHKLAHDSIQLGVKLDKRSNRTIGAYVNDAIDLGLTSEQPLYYSDNAFGTPDTIGFRRNKLRIHDLKTGIGKASEKQLMVYAALFCLEYGRDPYELDIEMRIYQNDDVQIYTADPDDIAFIMDKIVEHDKRIEFLKAQED